MVKCTYIKKDEDSDNLGCLQVKEINCDWENFQELLCRFVWSDAYTIVITGVAIRDQLLNSQLA